MQLIPLELLAPARNADIGIAAIDCGADAVYIAGPAFGARAAAGNDVADIARLCRYAHRYGAKVHATVNTLIQDDEVAAVERLMRDLYDAGVDVFIIQDLNLPALDLPPVELHASTQTAIRTPERAQALAALGFSRLVLERQLSLEEVRAIRAAVPDSCGLEFFLHGAICVGFSGECYLSQQMTGRSANRGVCAQVCRSRYDLVDADGRVIARNRTLLSPKDLRLDASLPDLVAAGITSFKIEGRLKNASYVKNIVRHYRNVLDAFIAGHPDYGRASAGRLEGGFTPDPDRTFGRGWTDAFLKGRQSGLMSGDAAKSMGEYIGEIRLVRGHDIVVSSGKPMANGDGLSFADGNGDVTGRRVEVAQGDRLTLRDTCGLTPGMRVYRNFDIRFERELEKNPPRRVLDVALEWQSLGEETVVTASSQGISVEKRFVDTAPLADKPEAALENLHRQLGKHTGPFAFALDRIEAEPVRFYPAAFLNGIRRELAEALQTALESRPRTAVPHTPQPDAGRLNRSTLDIPAELLRSRYCIRRELGICGPEPLWLVNQNNRLRLQFDCRRCEMVILSE